MTDKQEAYARKLRQMIMAVATAKQGWDYPTSHTYFDMWGFGTSLRALDIDQLLELLATVRGHSYAKPGKPIKEMNAHRKSAPGMATDKQIRYAGVLAGRYAQLRGISQKNAFASWHDWVCKYQGIDALQWVTKGKATETISVMERVFITTFGVNEFVALTGKDWARRSPKYAKYLNKTPEDYKISLEAL